MSKQIVYLQPNEEIAEQFTQHLASDEITILHAKSGEEALEIIKKEKVLLLLIDINIPDMRLRKLVEKVRRISPQIILNVCIDVLDPLLITKLSNRHNIHKIYVAPWNTDEIVEEMRDSLEVAIIDEQVNVREQGINLEMDQLKETIESLKETLKKQQRSYTKFSNITKCFTDAFDAGSVNDAKGKRKYDFAMDIFTNLLKMQTTGSFDTEKFEDEIKEDMVSLKSLAKGIVVGDISTCLLGGQSKAYAQNIRFGIYLIARLYAQYYDEYKISASSHYITTRLSEVCIKIETIGTSNDEDNTFDEYLAYVKEIMSGMTEDFRIENNDGITYYCSFPVSGE